MTYGDLFDGKQRNSKFPTTDGMTDAEVLARQLASRRVTVKPRPLDPNDAWDSTRAPRPARLLVNVPTVDPVPMRTWVTVTPQGDRDYGPFGHS